MSFSAVFKFYAFMVSVSLMVLFGFWGFAFVVYDLVFS